MKLIAAVAIALVLCSCAELPECLEGHYVNQLQIVPIPSGNNNFIFLPINMQQFVCTKWEGQEP